MHRHRAQLEVLLAESPMADTDLGEIPVAD
jgi:hypothetical protein